jgi:hypothetical protein
MEDGPFSEGAFRQAYRAKLTLDTKVMDFVCKFAKDQNTARLLYFNDAEAQGVAVMWARKYNEFKPPKLIEFVSSYVIELVDRPGRPVCGAEKYIPGDFRKHNNNVGAVVPIASNQPKDAALDSLTAQAFSHFTYQTSNQKILICDIQGVAGLYTDPQIHTLSGKGFGEGNLGMTGITAFLLRHRCNELCTQLNLTKIQAKDINANGVASIPNASTAAPPDVMTLNDSSSTKKSKPDINSLKLAKSSSKEFKEQSSTTSQSVNSTPLKPLNTSSTSTSTSSSAATPTNANASSATNNSSNANANANTSADSRKTERKTPPLGKQISIANRSKPSDAHKSKPNAFDQSDEDLMNAIISA